LQWIAMHSPPRLLLHPRFSRSAVALIVATHAMTAALLMWLPLSIGLRLAGSAVIACGCAIALRNVVGRASPASLQVDIDRRIHVTTRDGRVREGEVLGDSYVGSRLTTIVWRPDGAWLARTILVLADTLPTDDFRQLRIVLRYGRVPVATAGNSEADAG
jgi:hypothetical protein